MSNKVIKKIFINIQFIMYKIYTIVFKRYSIFRNVKKKFGLLDLLFRRIAKVGSKVGVKVATVS